MGPTKGLNNKVEVVSPFLKKTYGIVDDPSTDDIVSWTRNGHTFTVWKEVEFCQLLRHHFNHTKLSSFVRQLNTYGFRKLDPERLEYGNNKFLKGHNCLLQGIRRRKPSKSKSYAKPRRLREEEAEQEQEKLTLVVELERTKKHQQEMESTIQSLQDRILIMERTQQKLLQFVLATKSNFSISPINLDTQFLDVDTSLRSIPEKEGDNELQLIENALYSSITRFIQPEIRHAIGDSSSYKENLVHEARDDEQGTIVKCFGNNSNFW